MIDGWLLDLYPRNNQEIVVWIKQKDGHVIPLVDSWSPAIYVASDDRSELEYVLQRPDINTYIQNWSFEEKFEKVTDSTRTPVLKLTLAESAHPVTLAKKIQRSCSFGVLRLYNVDVPAAQSYLYEKDLFPFAHIKAEKGCGQITWLLEDSVESTGYALPPLTSITLTVKVNARTKLPHNDDPIESITVNSSEPFVINTGSEVEKLMRLVELVEQLDPDIIRTRDGDSFTFPYLVARACSNQVLDELRLGRDRHPLPYRNVKGHSYSSYGKILYRPSTHRLFGRVHLDESNTFIFGECGLEGLIEVARVCRMPLHTALRASIGKCMSSLQFYQATKDGLLIPWKATLAEKFKDAWELLVADRGGFIFEPRLGVYDEIGELDFSSLYPTIMERKNLSAETVACNCCKDSLNVVPEVGYNVCEKKRGIVPKTLSLLLRKRAEYKTLKSGTTSPQLQAKYDARQAALKWILVCSFGYLSFRNAKFGRIDAHIAVCAFARKIFLEATRIAERNGFRVVHGIVDSLWLSKNGVTSPEFIELGKEIQEETGFPLSFAGLYCWIAFLPSKLWYGIPVLNRYFGCFQNGEFKIRGIEVRRRDTPKFIRDCQLEMFKVLAATKDAQSARTLIPETIRILRSYLMKLRQRQIPVSDLVITKQISKNPDDYAHDILQAVAARQLQREGQTLSAGQTVSYVILASNHADPNRRAIAAELATEDLSYDVSKYSELLLEAAATILTPFGCFKDRIAKLAEMEPLHPPGR